MNPEVVIAGAGPAGLAAAIVLARRGIRTMLCDAGELPVDKPCGEGLMPRGIWHLERLGFSRREIWALGEPITGVRYVSPSGRDAEASFAEGLGVGIARVRLAGALLDLAARQPALTVLARTPVRLVSAGPRPCVTAGGARLEPRLVIGADGLHSAVRRDAGIESRSVPPLRFGSRRHYLVLRRPARVEVHWAEGAEAYVTPIAERQVNVALLWDRDARHARDPDHTIWDSFPRLADELEPLAALCPARSAGPMHHEVSLPATDGVVLLGDAAGYTDALTGDGVALAVEQALLLEELVVPRLHDLDEGQSLSLGDLEPFVRAAQRARRENRRLSSWLLRVKRHPAALEAVIGALSADPRLFRHYLSVAQGSASCFRPPLGGTARALLRLARRAHQAP